MRLFTIIFAVGAIFNALSNSSQSNVDCFTSISASAAEFYSPGFLATFLKVSRKAISWFMNSFLIADNAFLFPWWKSSLYFCNCPDNYYPRIFSNNILFVKRTTFVNARSHFFSTNYQVEFYFYCTIVNKCDISLQ